MLILEVLTVQTEKGSMHTNMKLSPVGAGMGMNFRQVVLDKITQKKCVYSCMYCFNLQYFDFFILPSPNFSNNFQFEFENLLKLIKASFFVFICKLEFS